MLTRRSFAAAVFATVAAIPAAADDEESIIESLNSLPPFAPGGFLQIGSPVLFGACTKDAHMLKAYLYPEVKISDIAKPVTIGPKKSNPYDHYRLRAERHLAAGINQSLAREFPEALGVIINADVIDPRRGPGIQRAQALVHAFSDTYEQKWKYRMGLYLERYHVTPKPTKDCIGSDGKFLDGPLDFE